MIRRLFQIFSTGALVLFPALPIAAEVNWDRAVSNARDALQQAVEERNRELREAESERQPMVRELRELEAELQVLRRDVEGMTRQREEWQRVLRLSREEQRRERENRDFVQSLGQTFREEQARSLWGRRSPLPPDFTFSQSLSHAMESARNSLGGTRWTGSIILPTGEVVEGPVTQWGPFLFYHDPARGTGTLERRPGVNEWLFISLPPAIQPATDIDLAHGNYLLPLDPTLGDANRRETEQGGIGQQIMAGGWIMIPILSLGLISIFIFLWKSAQLLKIPRPSLAEVQGLIDLARRGDAKALEGRLARVPRAAREIFQLALDRVDWEREALEEILAERILTWRLRLESYLPVLAVTAAVAPLLGLLGTVTGMIFTFDLISFYGTGDARSLSGGISEALITTQYGLIVAIPALIAHAFLQRRVRGILAGLEQWAIAALNELQPADGEPAP